MTSDEKETTAGALAELPAPVPAAPGTAAPTDRAPRAPRRGWVVLLAATVGQFLVVLDVSVVNVAMPSMREGLGMSPAGLQWVVNAYALTFAGFLLLGGRAADLFGRKPVYLVGLGLFTAASLAGGLAGSTGTLIAARAVQGVGAAVLAPVTLSLITSTFPEGPARVRAIATWSAVGTAGGAAGGLVGGLLTDLLSWHWVLLVNVPIGVAVGALVAWGLTERRTPGARVRLDLPGAVLVTAGVGALAYGIGRTETLGWTAPGALLPLAGGLLALAAFVAVEARSSHPLVRLTLFTIRSVAAGNAVTLVSSIGGFAMWYFLSLYMQQVLGYSAIRAGLSFLPHTAAIILGSKLAPRLMARYGSRTMTAVGGLVSAAGFLWQSWALSAAGADGTFTGTVLGPGPVMAGGFGLLMTPLTDAATAGVDGREAGAVAGLVNTSRQIGGALGLAALSAVSAVAASGAEPAPGAHAGSAGAGAADGYAAAFLAAALVTAAAMALVALLPRRR